jgi:hypothetical protein
MKSLPCPEGFFYNIKQGLFNTRTSFLQRKMKIGLRVLVHARRKIMRIKKPPVSRWFCQ